MEPDHDALLDVRERQPPDVGTDREQDDPQQEVRPSPGRDPYHHDEHTEEEQRRAHVAFEQQHRQRGAPREEQGPEILHAGEPEPPDTGRQQLAALREIGREEDHDQDAAELGGLELKEPEVHPQPCSVDLVTEAGDDRQEQQHDAR